MPSRAAKIINLDEIKLGGNCGLERKEPTGPARGSSRKEAILLISEVYFEIGSGLNPENERGLRRRGAPTTSERKSGGSAFRAGSCKWLFTYEITSMPAPGAKNILSDFRIADGRPSSLEVKGVSSFMAHAILYFLAT